MTQRRGEKITPCLRVKRLPQDSFRSQKKGQNLPLRQILALDSYQEIILELLIRQELPGHGHLDPVAVGIFLFLHVKSVIDGAHDAVTELFVDD